jgi:hypothetical protein
MYTVSHLAFLVARYMGCNPIILAGLDLSFPENKHHSKGCAKTWAVDFEKWQFIEIEDVHGGKVKTCDQFLYMLRLLEREIARTDALCIDATEGGARIKGTTVLPLEEALHLYAKGKDTGVTSKLKEIVFLSRPTDNNNLDQGLRWLDTEIKHASKIIKSANGIIEQAGSGGGITPEVLFSLETMKKQIVERSDFINVLGDLLSDLLIHEIRLSREAKEKLFAETKKKQEAIEAYKYFFSKLNEILSLITKEYEAYLNV